MKSRLIPILLACASASLAHADFNPVTLTANSYTFDIVVESNAPAALPYCINATSGSGTSEGDNTYYEQGLYARAGQTGGNLGIPIHNTIFTNINNSKVTFLMPPDYTTNNDLQIDSGLPSATLTFNAATTATNLAILSGGAGSGVVNYTVTHSDSTTDTGSISLSDWFSPGSVQIAWGANGRISASGGYDTRSTSSVNNVNPYLYSYYITVSGAVPITSITFTFSSGNEQNFYAVSGNAAGAYWTPIPVGGFNRRTTVPATFPLTATMDQGTNTANNGNLATWFEQGYIRGTPAVGLPPSGSTFNSLAQPTHHYQMGNYSTNNGILVDHAHPVVNITPAIQTNLFSAFSLLTAGGNIGSGNKMTNTCILQHLDGVNETNLFYGYDWFENTVSPAFIANGRVNMYSRTVNNVNNNYPRLFETYFTLNDAGSPVTNIMVQYGYASAASATTFIMAVSASAGGVAPLITSGPQPTVQAWYPTQTANFAFLASGTAPVTNTWLVEKNGVYVPLTDGVDANGSTVSGSATPNLSISNLMPADATNYEFIVANAFGSVTSTPAILEVKGLAGVVPIAGWNNIANEAFALGNSTNIYASNGVTTATLTLTDGGATNGYSSGITGDGANYSLMHGYMDTGNTIAGFDGVATISGLNDASYDVYIYCLADITRPTSATTGLPNYSVNGTIYYAPVIGGSTASTYDATTNSIGGTGFHGFVPATTYSVNDTNQDIPVSSFGNYIKIAGVAAVGGVITVQAEADTNSYRSPLNGIELVSTSNDGQDFGIHFLGNTTDIVASGQPVAPIIDSQTPVASTVIALLTNRVMTTSLSVAVDATSATPLYYQWYNGLTLIPNATSSSYVNTDTNNASLYCVVSNFVGMATSSPVVVNIYLKPTPSTYQAAIFAYNPVAYWPLTETNGTIAYDYAGTNDGTYTGTYTLGNAGLPPSVGIGANTSVGFDGSTAYVNIPVRSLNITNALTVIEWVQPPSGGDTGFTTPLGHSDQSYRLDVAGGQPHFADAGPDIISPATINDGNWHQLIGVYDGTNESLYVDGQPAGTPHTSSPAGSTDNVWIGGAPDYAGARNFKGNIAQVAILTNALSAAQVVAIYNDLDTPPTVSITPANPMVYAGYSVTLTAQLSGTPATSLQWYTIDTLGNSNNISGQTGSTYTIASATLGLNNYTYGIIAANAFGTNTAAVVLSVQNGPAYLSGDISPLNGEAYVGAPVTYSVSASGSLPIYYQWTVDGTAVAGATNASYTAPAACGTHSIQVTFTNSVSGGTPGSSSTATLQGDASPTNVTFNTDGTSWQVNASGFTSVLSITSNVIALTDGNGNESSSAFYMVPQYVGSFAASFTYTGNGSADGAAFIIQNNPSGATALGGGGGGLGYYGISNSVALEINLYPNNGEIPGIAAGTNGNTFAAGGGGQYQAPSPINITSGDPINIQLNFANGVLAVSMLDTVNQLAFQTNYVFGSLPAILNGSNLGYVGFSGGDGGATSIQTISNFEFNSVIPPVSLKVSPLTAKSFMLSWPAADPSYELQVSPSLSAPSWGAGPTAVNVGGINQATVTVGSGTQFYRLVRVVCQ